jgi:hypothetical protein
MCNDIVVKNCASCTGRRSGHDQHSPLTPLPRDRRIYRDGVEDKLDLFCAMYAFKVFLTKVVSGLTRLYKLGGKRGQKVSTVWPYLHPIGGIQRLVVESGVL